ncbi:MAG: hypothetical protein PHU25_01640 [Deltaproteobacteria bacterium]|nr:hypothetical protein [Deltaproteobacteria bacterium]
MKKNGIVVTVLAAALFMARSSPAAAGTEPEEDDAIGLNLDLGFASAYVFRGYNVFQEDSQLDQHMLIAPGITWTIFDTGLSIGYWGAYQISGEDIGGHIHGALGAEQDIILGYTLTLPHDLSLSFGLVGYLYPWADKSDVGAKCPVFLEPGAGLAWAGPVDLSLKVSYFLGLQDEPAIRGLSYLYVNPRVGKTFAFGERVKLSVGVGYGFKLWQEGNDGASNIHDVALDVSLPIDIAFGLYVTPSVHTGWTNLVEKGLADELFVYGGLNVGVNL